MRIKHGRIPNIGVSTCSIDTGKIGPRIAITANIHGDELTGLVVVHHLLEELPQWLTSGIVQLYPSLNPEGLSSCNRLHPMSGRDLNRFFSGKGEHGASIHCAAIWSHICQFKPDILLDLHTDSGDALPYVIMDRVLNAKASLENKLCELADASGLAALWEYSEPNYSYFNLHHSLTGAVVNQLGVPALTLEVGPRRAVSLSSVQQMKAAVYRILSHKGLISKSLIDALDDDGKQTRLQAGDWRRASGPLTLHAGYWYPQLSVGTHVVEGEQIGVVLDSSGSICQTITAPRGGVILAYPDKAALVYGQSCFTMAVPES